MLHSFQLGCSVELMWRSLQLFLISFSRSRLWCTYHLSPRQRYLERLDRSCRGWDWARMRSGAGGVEEADLLVETPVEAVWGFTAQTLASCRFCDVVELVDLWLHLQVICRNSWRHASVIGGFFGHQTHTLPGTRVPIASWILPRVEVLDDEDAHSKLQCLPTVFWSLWVMELATTDNWLLGEEQHFKFNCKTRLKGLLGDQVWLFVALLSGIYSRGIYAHIYQSLWNAEITAGEIFKSIRFFFQYLQPCFKYILF